MEFNEVDKELKKFGNYIIQQSRSNLTKGKRNYTKELYNSLSYKLEESGDGFIIDFFMEDYGLFQDQGVKGANPKKLSSNAQITGQQAPINRFFDNFYLGWFIRILFNPKIFLFRYLKAFRLIFLVIKEKIVIR